MPPQGALQSQGIPETTPAPDLPKSTAPSVPPEQERELKQWAPDRDQLRRMMASPESALKNFPRELNLPGVKPTQQDAVRWSNLYFISQLSNVHPSEFLKNYGQLRQELGKEMLGLNPNQITDETFYQGAQRYFQRQELQEQNTKAMAANAMVAAMRQTDPGEAFEAWKAQHEGGEGWFPENEDNYRAMFSLVFAEWGQKREKFAGVLDETVSFLSQNRGTFSPFRAMRGPNRDRLLRQFHDMDPSDVQMVISIASEMILAQDAEQPQQAPDRERSREARAVGTALPMAGSEMGFMEETGTTSTRGSRFVAKMGENVLNAAASILEGAYDALAQFEPDKEMRNVMLRQGDYTRMLDDALNNELDPREKFNWFAEQFIGAAESLPYMYALQHPVGIALVNMSNMTESRRRYTQNGVSEGKAQIMSFVAAPLQTASQIVQMRMIFKNVPQVPRPARTLKDLEPARRIMRGLLTYGTLVTAETGQEFIEFVAPLVVQGIWSVFDEHMDGPQWRQEFSAFSSNLPELVTQVGILSLIGSGRVQKMEMDLATQLTKNADLLGAVGFKSEQVERIMRQTNHNKAVKLVEEMWNEREMGTPEQEASLARIETSIAEGKELMQQQMLNFIESQPTQSDTIAQQFPDFYMNLLTNPFENGNVMPILVRKPDGEIIPMLHGGYWDAEFAQYQQKQIEAGTVHPELIVSHVWTEGGWSSGIMPGYEILSKYPTREQWEQGVRDFDQNGNPVTRDYPGQGVVVEPTENGGYRALLGDEVLAQGMDPTVVSMELNRQLNKRFIREQMSSTSTLDAVREIVADIYKPTTSPNGRPNAALDPKGTVPMPAHVEYAIGEYNQVFSGLMGAVNEDNYRAWAWVNPEKVKNMEATVESVARALGYDVVTWRASYGWDRHLGTADTITMFTALDSDRARRYATHSKDLRKLFVKPGRHLDASDAGYAYRNDIAFRQAVDEVFDIWDVPDLINRYQKGRYDKYTPDIDGFVEMIQDGNAWDLTREYQERQGRTVHNGPWQNLMDIMSKSRYDTMTIKDGGDGRTGDNYMVFNPALVKFADALTFRTDGTPIPINERFNDEAGDPNYMPEPEGIRGEIVTDHPETTLDGTIVPPWDATTGNIMVQTSIAKLKSHPSYQQGKKGDEQAALSVVSGVANKAKLKSLADQFPQAVIVPVFGMEREGMNKLPLAYAMYMSQMTGLPVHESLVMTNVPARIGSDGWYRLTHRPEFNGQIVIGQEYIIVDDVATQGGTLSELRAYIESHGGKVVAVSTLAAAQFSTVLAIRAETKQKLIDRYGQQELTAWLQRHGLYNGEIGALSEGEARIILGAKTLAEAESRISSTRTEIEHVQAQDPAQANGLTEGASGRRGMWGENDTNFPPIPMAQASKILATRTGYIKDMAKFMRKMGHVTGGFFTGRVFRKRVLGYYSPHEHIIRLAVANSMTTASHEFGHALERVLFGKKGRKLEDPKAYRDGFDPIPSGAIAELRELGKTIYPKEPGNGWASEGMAEFTMLYFTVPAEAKAKAPQFYSLFQDKIDSLPGGMKKLAAKIQQQGAAWYGQGAVQRAIQSFAPPRTTATRVVEGLDDARKSFFRLWVDSLAPMYDMVDQANRENKFKISRSHDPAQLASALRMSIDGRLAYMLKNGMLDIHGNKIPGSTGLIEAFKIIDPKTENELFLAYLYAQRAAALWGDVRGARNPGLSKEDAHYIIEQVSNDPALQKRFDKASEIVWQWSDAILDYAASADPGYADIVNRIRMVDPGNFIPLYREWNSIEGVVKSSRKDSMHLQSQLKGSGRRVLDIVENLTTYARRIMEQVDRRRIENLMVAMAESNAGIGRWITRVNPPKEVQMKAPTGFLLSEMIKQNPAFAELMEQALEVINQEGSDLLTDEGGIDPNILSDLVYFYQPATSMPTTDRPYIIRSAPRLPGRPPSRRFYEVDPELYASLTKLDRVDWRSIFGNHAFYHTLFKGLVTTPTRMFRMGTTGLNATFSLVTNPLRDLRTLQVNSASSAHSGELFMYWLDSMKDTFMHSVTAGKWSNEWMDTLQRLSIPMASFLGQDSQPLQTMVRHIKRGGRWSPLDIGSMMEYLSNVLSFPEQAARLAEMKAIAKDMGWDPSQPLNAGSAVYLKQVASNVTTNFTAAGDYVRFINQILPFFNAGIQGPRAYARAAQRDPAKFMRRGLMGTAMTMLLWWQNKDDDWWYEMSPIEKYTHSYIKGPQGELFRIPRAFEVDAIFMGVTEALLDAWYYNEPERVTQFFAEFLESLSQGNRINDTWWVPPMPPLAAAVVGLGINRDIFFDSPIEGRFEDSIFPEDRYSSFTSNLSIALSRAMPEDYRLSPKQLDFVIRNIFGGTGLDIAKVFGTGGPEAKLAESEDNLYDLLSNTVVTRGLMTSGGQVARNPRSIEQLYDRLQYAQRMHRRLGDDESPEDRETRLMLSHAVGATAALRNLRKLSTSREERREFETLAVKTARAAIRAVDEGDITNMFKVLQDEYRREVESRELELSGLP